MEPGKLQKIFGVGPAGAAISILLFILLIIVSQVSGYTASVMLNALPLQIAGAVLVILGLSLHVWTFLTLRSWWIEDQLCTMGPFKIFRHPMYAAWITFISTGVILYLNSWIYFLWILLVHPIWHWLVKKEEKIMYEKFGSEYSDYANKTGRFFPRLPGR